MKFSEVTGQQRVKNLFVQSVRNNRVSHAQLLTGPAGSGKLALALAFAQFVSCENKQYTPDQPLKGDSCGTCPSCVKYAKLAHPDLHFYYPVAPVKDMKKAVSKDFIHKWREILLKQECLVDLQEWYDHIGMENKQGIINAEDCNDMSRVLAYKAYESEYKIVVIWHAEKFYHAAAPKILKILEEPPDKTLFLLISENTDLILNTILSRTQIVKIPKLNQTEVVTYLMECKGLSEPKAYKLALLSDGDLKLALTLADDSEEEDHNFVTLRDWFRLCFTEDVLSLVPYIEIMAKMGRERQKSLLMYGMRIARRCMLLHYRLDVMIKLEGEELTFVQKLSPFINPGNVDRIYTSLNEAVYHIERNANAKILFMDLSLQMAGFFKIKA